MINYNNRDLWFIFFNRAGSVLFSRYVIVPATVSTIFCGLIIWQPESRRYSGSSNTVAQIYSTIIGFAIVFRVNMAFGRYFEGVQHIQAMFAKWRDAFIATSVFLETSISKHEDNARLGHSNCAAVASVVSSLRFSKARLLHWFSLLCAVAVQSIQHGRDEEVSLAEDLSKAQVFATSPFAVKSGGSGSASTGGGPYNSESSFGGDPIKRTDTERFKMQNRVQVLGEITPQELHQVSHAQEAVNLVMIWILNELSDISITKQILTEPPILSRVYQELSYGALSYFRAMQIECVPFPFPFAQVINYCLYGFFFFCPFIVMQIIRDFEEPGPIRVQEMWPALVLNFFACVGYAALNEIAIELEDPFGDDNNDYPVAIQQWAITWTLEDSYFAPVPFDYKSSSNASMWSMGSSAYKLPTNVELSKQVAALSASEIQKETCKRESTKHSTGVDRGPLSRKFNALRGAISIFVEDINQQGREREEQREETLNLSDLVEKLAVNLRPRR